jgi:hypothetical protein
MLETLEFLATFARFPAGLRRFLRERLTPEQAAALVRGRLARREENFLRVVEQGVYAWPRSPYLPLLRQAGCEPGDLRALVQDKGLEGALRDLRAAGVYVAFEEFKGRRPLRRGGVELAMRGRDFDNPLARRELIMQTGGSTGAAQAVGVDLDNLAARAAHRLVTLAAHGLLGAPTAVWQGGLPAPGLRKTLFGAKIGNVPRRWFSPAGRRDSRHWLKYGAATYYQVLCLRLAGVQAPFPAHVPVEQALVIARWAAETARREGRCLVYAGVSRAARLGMAAQAAGLDLGGVTIAGGGEPPTPAKVSRVTSAGARYIPGYGMIDAGQLGAGCAAPADVSDVHLFTDAVALIAHPRRLERYDVTVPAFHLTTLLPTASKLLLNVEMDDYGIVEERACGCDLAGLGYSTHLRQIRSYAKLTGEGVTLIGDEILRIVEETLPARFGGTALDYQLVEEEDRQGFTRLYLVVHPRVALADETAVVDCVLDGLRRSSAMADAARTVWQRAGTLQVRRTEPTWTPRGKLQPLYVARRAAETAAAGRERTDGS